MDYTIRAMNREEFPLLDDFLYETIYIPDGAAALPKSVTGLPELQVYIRGFGRSRYDKALVGDAGGDAVGCA